MLLVDDVFVTQSKGRKHVLEDIYPHIAWLNPTHPSGWEYSGSTDLIRQIIGPHRMFPLTVKGVEEATKELKLPVTVVTYKRGTTDFSSQIAKLQGQGHAYIKP